MDDRLSDLAGLGRRPAETWRARGWWGRLPLWQRVGETAASTPGKAAVIDGEVSVTYGELWERAGRLAGALAAQGVGSRDVVLVQLPNWNEFPLCVVAIELAGAVFAFCPIQWDLRETVRALRLTRPKLWITTRVPRPGDDRGGLIREAIGAMGGTAPACILVRSAPTEGTVALADALSADPPAELRGGQGSDPLEIAVTSGSTGDPKGVLHIHDSALATVDSTIERQGFGPADIVHLAVPVGHTFGYFYGVRCALQMRGTLLLQERWDAATMVELVARHRATVSLGPSAFLIDLLALPPREIARLGSVRVFTHSGDSLPVPVVRKAVEAMPFRISRALGMTEFGHACSTDAATPVEQTIESLGTPQPEMRIEIRDDEDRPVPAGREGRILVSGPFLFTGYLTEERLNQDVLGADGFFDTGDLGLFGNDGSLRITGRVKNVIRRGAETVPVSLLEDTIASHPDVINAVVVGVPDPRLGEVPVACVQPRPGSHLALADIQTLFERARITKKFWPTDLRLVETWPIGATGKIDRRRIAADIQATMGRGQ
jgi:acyl-CoA synthetase (AMP-forming)/AMP-acid ligase II